MTNDFQWVSIMLLALLSLICGQPLADVGKSSE